MINKNQGLNLTGARAVSDVVSATMSVRTEKLRSPIVARRVATLERQAPHIVNLAKSVDAKVDYLGIAPLFAGALMFPGTDTDWIVESVGIGEMPIVPRQQRESLERMEASGAHFPMVYVAHEVRPTAVRDVPAARSKSVVSVPSEQAKELVGVTPMPASSLDVANRLNTSAHQVFKAMARMGSFVGAVAAAPLLLLESATSALSTLDPMVLGVIPALYTEPGEPGAWFVLAKWDW
jgi:hypothetical protein